MPVLFGTNALPLLDKTLIHLYHSTTSTYMQKQKTEGNSTSMSMPYTQADLLRLLQIDHNHFTTVVTRLSEEEQLQAFSNEGWSVKDFLDHMAHWNNAANRLLSAYLYNQPL